MPLSNLFSKPLNFANVDCHASLSDKSNFPKESSLSESKQHSSDTNSHSVISKPNENSTIVNSKQGKSFNKKSINKNSNKKGLPDKTKKSLKGNNSTKKERSRVKARKAARSKERKYIDYDGISCRDNDSCLTWGLHKEGNKNEGNTSTPESNSFCSRPIISYNDEPSLASQNRNARRKLKKRMMRAQMKLNKMKKEKFENNSVNQNVNSLESRTEMNKILATEQGNNANSCVGHHWPEQSGYFGQQSFIMGGCNEEVNARCNVLKRKLTDQQDDRVAKLRKTYDDCIPIIVEKEKKLLQADEKEIMTDGTRKKENETRQPLSKKQLMRIEKNRLYRERMKEKAAREANHQQGVQKKTVPCKFFVKGSCHKGDECAFSHDVPREKKDEVCKFYVMSTCAKAEACLYRHAEWPCKFFHSEKKCMKEACKFSHEPLTEVTKMWLNMALQEDETSRRARDEIMETQHPQQHEVLQPPTENENFSFYGNPSHPFSSSIPMYKLIPIELDVRPQSLYSHFEDAIKSNKLKTQEEPFIPPTENPGTATPLIEEPELYTYSQGSPYIPPYVQTPLLQTSQTFTETYQETFQLKPVTLPKPVPLPHQPSPPPISNPPQTFPVLGQAVKGLSVWCFPSILSGRGKSIVQRKTDRSENRNL